MPFSQACEQQFRKARSQLQQLGRLLAHKLPVPPGSTVILEIQRASEVEFVVKDVAARQVVNLSARPQQIAHVYEEDRPARRVCALVGIA